MPKLLALDWDSREIRIAVARGKGDGIILDEAFAIDLPESGDPAKSRSRLGEAMAAALAARDVGRCDTLVSIGRSRIELRSLTLPPCPIDELPELVRFQALQQFANITEAWPIDFVHLATGDDEQLNVLAAALSPAVVSEVAEVCGLAGQTPKHLILRPFAAASLLRRHKDDSQCYLLVDLAADEADLTVVADRQLGFTRTVRLPADETARNTSILGEIRRTVAAAQAQLGGRKVERIILCGSNEEHAGLKSFLEEKQTALIEVFDPLSVVRLGERVQKSPPAGPGRFAPLLGMLLDEASSRAHAIDFLNPRKKAAPKSPRRRMMVLGSAAAAAALLLLAAMIGWYWSLGWKIEELQEQVAEKTKLEQAVNEQAALVQPVEKWKESDIVWLEEMAVLSEEFPPEGEGEVNSMFAVYEPRGGGRYTIDASVNDKDDVVRLESSLRNDRRKVTPGGVTPGGPRAEYAWQFNETVELKPNDKP